jgi:DNA repair protein RadC
MPSDLMSNDNININDLPKDQRPREKLANLGASSLSDAELLAIFLRVGVKGQSAIEIGRRLLKTYGSLSQLSRLELSDLAKEFGLGIAKAAQLCASFEIAARISRESIISTSISKPLNIYNAIVPQLRLQTTESLHVMLADSRLCHIRTVTVSQGTVNQTTCHPRDVLRPVINSQAHGFVLVHNHPSGDPSPSYADDEMTRVIIKAANLMQVRFVDHVIIGQSIDGKDPYYSYRESSELF